MQTMTFQQMHDIILHWHKNEQLRHFMLIEFEKLLRWIEVLDKQISDFCEYLILERRVKWTSCWFITENFWKVKFKNMWTKPHKKESTVDPVLFLNLYQRIFYFDYNISTNHHRIGFILQWSRISYIQHPHVLNKNFIVRDRLLKNIYFIKYFIKRNFDQKTIVNQHKLSFKRIRLNVVNLSIMVQIFLNHKQIHYIVDMKYYLMPKSILFNSIHHMDLNLLSYILMKQYIPMQVKFYQMYYQQYLCQEFNRWNMHILLNLKL